MMIKQAQKNQNPNLPILIYDAIKDIAHTLTGEDEIDKVLSTLDMYINMDVNRLSYNNIWIYEIHNQAVGLILAYDSNDLKRLDAPILDYLASKNIFKDSFEMECFPDEFYIDTVSVDSHFQGRGIAKKLFTFIENKAKEVGYSKLSLLVDVDNKKALTLYKKLGFQKNTILEVSNHNYHHMIKIV